MGQKKKKAPSHLLLSFEQRRELVQSLTMFDDEFFSVVMEDEGVCEEVLRVLTRIEDLRVKKVKTQFSLRHLKAHGAVLDALAEDSTGKLYDIEVQKTDDVDHGRRLRYYQGSMDTYLVDKGVKYEDLPELYLIYITKFDLFKLGLVKYEVCRMIRGTEICLDNGVHEIYISAASTDESTLSKLIQFFTETASMHMQFPKLSERIQYFKEKKEGIEHMSEVVERLVEQRKEEWQQEARAEEKHIMIQDAFKSGVPVKTIAQFSKLSEEEVREILAKA